MKLLFPVICVPDILLLSCWSIKVLFTCFFKVRAGLFLDVVSGELVKFLVCMFEGCSVPHLKMIPITPLFLYIIFEI